MYGMIHKAAREFAISELGQERWDKAVANAEMNDEHFISGQHYPDAKTNKLLGELVSISGLASDDLLERFGRYWIRFTSTTAYSSALDMAGDEIVMFLENLDHLHTSIQSTMPEADLPSFCVTHSSPTEIKLIYKSTREGLAPFVKGLLMGVLDRFSEAGEISFEPHGDDYQFHILRQSAA